MWPTQSDMKGHHRSLAEPNNGEVCVGQSVLMELSLNECCYRWCYTGRTRCQGLWRKGRQRPPLISRRQIAQSPGRIRCQKKSIRQVALPMRRQRNQIGAAGTIAVEKQHYLFGATAGQWLQARPVYDLGQDISSILQRYRCSRILDFVYSG